LFILVVFLFPRSCGNWGTAINPNAKYKDCTCIGIKYRDSLIGGGYITCFGVPVSYSCYYYKLEDLTSGTKPQIINITCE
jgi:hypothetical protein